jgi:hypothetical protein
MRRKGCLLARPAHSLTPVARGFTPAPRLDHTLSMDAVPQHTHATKGAVTISAGPRLRIAMILAIVADVLQLAVFPLVVEGAESPADDILDLCVGGLLTWLLGWHWEFLPSFLAKLVPGVDLVPLWTLAVANVYRKSKQAAVAAEKSGQEP